MVKVHKITRPARSKRSKGMLSQPEKSLRFKVWAAVFVTLILTFTAVTWSYKSFRELRASIDQLSEPNHKLTLINNILRDFISAENHVQSYIITGNVKSARIYEQQVDETRLRIKELKELVKADSGQLKRVDSLELVFQKKLDYLNRFLTLKKQRQATTFTRMALDQIMASTRDTMSVSDKSGTTFEVVQHKAFSTQQDSISAAWHSLRSLFGQDGIPYDTANWSGENYLSYLADPDEISVDVAFRVDSLLSKVKTVLAQTGDLELQMQQRLTQREYALLKQGEVFMNKIQTIITELESSERLNTDRRKEEASVIANSSTRIISLIGLGGLLIAVLLLILISRDITRAAYFRRRLESAKLKAEELGKMKESFLANMSHEIRTPLNSILGFTGLLKTTELSYDQKHYMNAVNSSSTYLMELVNDILDYSKIESGKLELVNKPFSTNELVRDLEGMFSLVAENKRLFFKVFADESVPEWLKGDVFRLKQIISNLVSNALKFTHEGKVLVDVRGRWFKEMFYMEVSVADTGIGIAGDKLDVIFESFRQEELSTADHFGGTGLGLNISRQLAEAMEGSISAISRKDEGTTFTLKLPFEKAHEPAVAEQSGSEFSGYLYDARVVIVEDDHWNALLLETLLRTKVREIHTFLSPEEALVYIKAHLHEIDLFLTDLKMPGMTGEELVRNCRKAGFTKPIVALTAHLSQNTSRSPGDLGVEAICTKPYNEQEITQILHRFLSQLEKDQDKAKKAQSTNLKTHSIDLTDLRLFSGDDPDTLYMLLKEMVENNRKQISLFQELVETEGWSSLGELAHKMQPTYDHVKAYRVSELLQSIELYAELSNYSRVEELSHEALEEIEVWLKEFEKLIARYHTV